MHHLHYCQLQKKKVTDVNFTNYILVAEWSNRCCYSLLTPKGWVHFQRWHTSDSVVLLSYCSSSLVTSTPAPSIPQPIQYVFYRRTPNYPRLA